MLAQHLKGLKLREEIGDKYGIAMTLSSIGNIHSQQGNHAQALEQYQQSLRTFEEIGDKASISMALNNTGVIHRLQGDHNRRKTWRPRSEREAWKWRH